MRKHDVRKWLHAILDLLPVILIPVFMIYSHRHDVAQDFTYTKTEPVYYDSNVLNSWSDLTLGNAYLWDDNFDLASAPTREKVFSIYNNEFIAEFYTSSYDVLDLYLSTYGNLVLDDGHSNVLAVTSITFPFVLQNVYSNSYEDILLPHISSNYDFIKEYVDIVVNIPKDVMTSFMDRFNNTINFYFNMGNVFHLQEVYEWFNVNIFNNNAPVVINSIYNIVIYELIMDLLFLLYALFMWFIDMVEKLMEKPLNSIK